VTTYVGIDALSVDAFHCRPTLVGVVDVARRFVGAVGGVRSTAARRDLRSRWRRRRR
jgi:hypothetical protein